jgi:hypothetical protein
LEIAETKAIDPRRDLEIAFVIEETRVREALKVPF